LDYLLKIVIRVDAELVQENFSNRLDLTYTLEDEEKPMNEQGKVRFSRILMNCLFCQTEIGFENGLLLHVL